MTDIELSVRLRACASGFGSLKSKSGDFGLCDDAADRIDVYVRAREKIQERVDNLRTNGHTYAEAVLQGTLEAILKEML